MSLERAKAWLSRWGLDGEVLEFESSSATVALAAAALGVEASRIAKTISLAGPGGPLLVVAAGDARLDNRKFKDAFGLKPRMLAPDEVERLVGHAIGGVCPFGVEPGVEVRLDVSLRRFDAVYPACGSPNSAIRLGLDRLEACSGSAGWVDVCGVPGASGAERAEGVPAAAEGPDGRGSGP